jgi:5-methylcytosine-specific restriction endonuclease McrA
MYESTVTTPELRLAHGLALLERAIDALSDVELTEASSVGLGEATLALGCQARRLSAVHARTADRFSTSGAWAADAARHARGWMVGRSNDSLGAIRGVLDTGAQLRTHPVMAEAVQDGSVSAAHLRVLADMHRRFPRLREPLLAQEAHIVSFARLAAPRRFEADLLALCHRLNPEQVAEDEGARETATYLHASTIMDGMVRVDALLPADELPAHLRDPRVPSQRNVEAFRRILNGAAAATDSSGAITLPAVNGSRPVVHVTIPLDSLLSESRNQAAGWLERFGVPIASISAVKAQALVCDGVVRPLIIDRKGQLIATLPGTRAVPPVLRRAVMMRDVHCRIPHCDARIDEVHHVVFASQGGATMIQNLVGLCWYHHHAIHKGTWQLTGDANSELILTRSVTGQSWSSRPPPAQGDFPTNTRAPFPESDHVVIS